VTTPVTPEFDCAAINTGNKSKNNYIAANVVVFAHRLPARLKIIPVAEKPVVAA
jgi:hypothetical protein